MVCHVKVLPRVTCDLTLISTCDQKQAKIQRIISHRYLWNSFLSVPQPCCEVWEGDDRQRCSSYSWEKIYRSADRPFYIHTQMRQQWTYASHLYTINNRMIMALSAQLCSGLYYWLPGGHSFQISLWRPGACCISSLEDQSCGRSLDLYISAHRHWVVFTQIAVKEIHCFNQEANQSPVCKNPAEKSSRGRRRILSACFWT